MRRVTILLLLATSAALAAPVSTPELPSWFPAADGLYDVRTPTYHSYDEFNLTADPKLLSWPQRNSGGYALLHGKVWRFDMGNPKPETWTATIEKLQQQGFKFVHGDLRSAKSSASLMKGTGEHATFVAFWQCCNSVAIIEPGSSPFHVAVKAPAATKESFGPKDDIPYVPGIDGSVVAAGRNDDKGNIFVSPECNGKTEAFGAQSSWRRYEGPSGLSDYAIQQAYEDAFRAAGWQQLCESGSHTLAAHFTKNGRDVWAKLRPTVDGNHGRYELTVADAGAGLRAELQKSCKAAVYGVNFDFDKATLRPDAEPALNQILALMKDDPKIVVEVGGHTDNVGKPDYNMKLSDERAAAVMKWLEQHGTAGSRVSSHGYGDTQPLVPNSSEDNRAKNRRVELKRADCNR